MINPIALIKAWFARRRAIKYLKLNNMMVRGLNTKSKLSYALYALTQALPLWDEVRLLEPKVCYRKYPRRIVFAGHDILSFNHETDSIQIQVTKLHTESQAFVGDYAKGLASGALDELLYAYSSLGRMIAIQYSEFNLSVGFASSVDCGSDEALARIASSIVSSVAIAYGYHGGGELHDSVYEDILRYGASL